jgi:selenocysteine lyase/cysteine desulfurase
MNQTTNVVLCIFSHISSMPTMIEPIKQLTKIAKSFGSKVILDGAHAPGSIDIDVYDLDGDYYTGNLHKWCYCPKGAAFLWTAPSVINTNEMHPQPVVISSTGRYDYIGRFAYTGTRDYTAFCTIPCAFQFMDNQLKGIDNIRLYCQTLLADGCNLLITHWQTGYLVPLSMCAFMANVILPIEFQYEEAAIWLQEKLFQDYHMTLVYGSVPRRMDGDITNEQEQQQSSSSSMIYFFRLSSQVYLSLEEFQILVDAVLELQSIRKNMQSTIL